MEELGCGGDDDDQHLYAQLIPFAMRIIGLIYGSDDSITDGRSHRLTLAIWTWKCCIE